MSMKHEQPSQPHPREESDTLRLLVAPPRPHCPIPPSPKLFRPRNRCAHVEVIRALGVNCWNRIRLAQR
jgi:hypothetical protein